MTVDKPRGSRPFGDKQHSTGPSTGQHHHGHAHGQQIGGFNRGGHQAQHGQHGHDHRQNWRDGQRSNNNPTYQNQKPNASRKINVYSPYLSEKEAKKGLETGQFLKGVFRVNPRNYEECYVSNPDGGDELDILIYGNVARNRAFQGDVVVLRIRDRANWAVNEALYKNWLASGELDSVIKKVNQSGDTANPNVSPVNVSDELAYDRNKMYSIRAQVVKRKDSCPSLLAYTDELVLKEVPETPPVELQPPPKVQQQQQRSNEKKNQRKVYKLLDEMPNKGEGIPDSCLQKTAEVVYILEKKLRIAMGHMRPMEKNTNTQFALFSPVDSKIPRMLIPLEQLPKEFATRPQDYSKVIFLARVTDWVENSLMPKGKLEKQVGNFGDIEAETEGMLLSNGVDIRDFSTEVIKSLPVTEENFVIDEKEYAYRWDLRNEVIFTIDPKTARDLDDALSIRRIPDCDGSGNEGWEVGVHIADVSFFVKEDTEVDEWAASRATSVYLVHKVIPMLPQVLCERLCSLNPGVDRLTFSVLWKMNDQGEVFEEKFGRSVIRSKVKLAYEHAQDIIDRPDRDFSPDELPTIHDGVETNTIRDKVLQLHRVAMALRLSRVQSGSLRLDQPKLKFTLNDEMNQPIGVTIYERKDSNSLVEEFMLLANMSVARKIENHFPKTSLLRRHPSPKVKPLKDALLLCEKIGFPIDGENSGTISSGIMRFRGDTVLTRCINQVISSIMMKPMQLAEYFCTGSFESITDYKHYALNVPFYTHFTSPIRRYPDVIVHRQLAAALEYARPSERTIEELEQLTSHCNEKKLLAKTVSEKSSELFFGSFVHRCGPFSERAVVMNVLDQSFDAMVFKYGIVKRIYLEKQKWAQEPVYDVDNATLTLKWAEIDGAPAIEQKIQMCSIVHVTLKATDEPLQYMALLNRPSASTTTKTLENYFSSNTQLDD